MTVEEAVPFFENLPSIRRKIETLNDVGLSYIKLGQPSTTLSGGLFLQKPYRSDGKHPSVRKATCGGSTNGANEL